MRPKWPKLASLDQKICTLFASKGYPFKNKFVTETQFQIPEFRNNPANFHPSLLSSNTHKYILIIGRQLN